MSVHKQAVAEPDGAPGRIPTGAPGRRGTVRTLLFTAGTLCVVAIVVLLIGEFVLRVLWPQQLIRAYVYPTLDSELLFRPNYDFYDDLGLPMYAYHVRTNEMGLRMNEAVDLSPGANRLLVVGDSYTFGWGVELEDSFVGILDRRLDLSALQVVNGGMGAASTGHVYRNMLRLHPQISPCGIVHFMSPNDPFDNVNQNIDYRVTAFEQGEDGRIALRDVEQYSRAKRLLLEYTPYQWLNQHSHLFVAFKSGVVSISGFRFSGIPQDGPSVGFDLDRPASDEAYARLVIDVTAAHMKRLDDFAQRNEVPLLIVWVPSWSEVYEPEHSVNGFFARLKERVRTYVAAEFHDPAGAFAEAIGDEHSMMQVYFPDAKPVGHMTETGNALYANAVGEAVSRFVERACLHGEP